MVQQKASSDTQIATQLGHVEEALSNLTKNGCEQGRTNSSSVRTMRGILIGFSVLLAILCASMMSQVSSATAEGSQRRGKIESDLSALAKEARSLARPTHDEFTALSYRVDVHDAKFAEMQTTLFDKISDVNKSISDQRVLLERIAAKSGQ